MQIAFMASIRILWMEEQARRYGFDRLDDGADIVETSYLLMGFLCAREYFNKDTPREVYLQKTN